MPAHEPFAQAAHDGQCHAASAPIAPPRTAARPATSVACCAAPSTPHPVQPGNPVGHAVITVQRRQRLAPLHHRPQQEALGLFAVGMPSVRALDAQPKPSLDGLVLA